MLVHADARGDGVEPGTQVLAVAQPRIAAQRAQECFLECVLRPLAPDAADEEAEDLVPMLAVKRFERGDPHGLHHRV